MSLDLTVIDDINKRAKELGNDLTLAYGKELVTPYPNKTSAQRLVMHSKHYDQAIQLDHPEVPLTMTGYENEFAHNSSSYVVANSDYLILAKIDKFLYKPNHHYWLIIVDTKNKTLDIIEKKDHRSNTESFGYIMNNDFLNSLSPNDTIKEGDVIFKPISVDPYGNCMKGVNLTAVYISSDNTMDDGFKISMSAANKLSMSLVKTISINMNDNDIMLNLYGDRQIYKCIPDINESLKDGILCAIRRENKNESLYSQSSERLREIFMSDTKYIAKGVVVDIDVRCNSPEMFQNSIYHKQIEYYYQNKMRYSKELLDAITHAKELYPKYQLSYELREMEVLSGKFLRGGKYITDNSQFSGMIVDVTVIEPNPMKIGDKITNRFAAKGVASQIVPDELMLRLPNGKPVDIEYNAGGVIGRNNSAQLFEILINRFFTKLIDVCKTNCVTNDGGIDYDKAFDYILRFTEIINRKFARGLLDKLVADKYKRGYIDSIFKDGKMAIIVPFEDDINLLTIERIFKEFPWTMPEPLYAPIVGANGKIRYVKTNKPISYGYSYVYRLKQYSEEQFSVTSLSSVNIRSENIRNKNNKIYKFIVSRTPIRDGEMENTDKMHMNSGYKLVTMLMLYSSSPEGRRAAESLLTGDPFDSNVNLPKTGKSRSVEGLSAYLKTMGLGMEFTKEFKQYKNHIIHKKSERYYEFNEKQYDRYIKKISRTNKPLKKPDMFIFSEKKYDEAMNKLMKQNKPRIA